MPRQAATGKLSLLLNLNFFNANRSARKILCLGAHCDDIEIGCGGTILRWLQQMPVWSFTGSS